MNGWLAANKKGHPKRAAFFAEHVERARCQAASMGNDWLRGSPRARIPIVVVTRRMSRMACSFSLPALRAGWSVAFYHIPKICGPSVTHGAQHAGDGAHLCSFVSALEGSIHLQALGSIPLVFTPRTRSKLVCHADTDLAYAGCARLAIRELVRSAVTHWRRASMAMVSINGLGCPTASAYNTPSRCACRVYACTRPPHEVFGNTWKVTSTLSICHENGRRRQEGACG
jgi:hypothetical protein